MLVKNRAEPMSGLEMSSTIIVQLRHYHDYRLRRRLCSEKCNGDSTLHFVIAEQSSNNSFRTDTGAVNQGRGPAFCTFNLFESVSALALNITIVVNDNRQKQYESKNKCVLMHAKNLT